MNTNSLESEHRYFSKYYSVIHTYILLIVLVGLYIYQFVVLGDGIDNYVTHTTDIFSGVYYTVVTALFFHTGIIHLLGNLLGLFLFGRVTEKHIGWRIYIVFLAGGVFANIVSNTIAFMLNQEYSSLGASSGIAAIILFAILLDPFKLTTLIGWSLIGLDIYGVSNVNSTTNHLAHLSGYFSLILLYFFIEHHHKKRVIKGLVINMVLLFLVYSILKLNGIFF